MNQVNFDRRSTDFINRTSEGQHNQKKFFPWYAGTPGSSQGKAYAKFSSPGNCYAKFFWLAKEDAKSFSPGTHSVPGSF